MPEWIHNRAEHIRAKNPSMPESEAFAIATQQAHAVGKSPKGYGTPEGRHEAKKKYDTPRDDKKTADPGHLGAEKTAELSSQDVSHLAPWLGSFTDELEKIANLSGAMNPTSPTNTPVKSRAYSQVNGDSSPSPVSQHQPVLTPPPVRR